MKITNETEYEKASERADEIFDAKNGTPEEKELQELLKAIKEDEDDFVRMLRENNYTASSMESPSTFSERVITFMPFVTGVAQAGKVLGAFSTSTKHIRQLAAIDNFLW